MSNFSTTSRPQLSEATTNKIYNLSMPLSATEYFQALDAGTKKVLIRMRNPSEARLSYASGGTNVSWITIKGTAVYSVDGLSLTGGIIYLQSPTATGQVAEIEQWS